MKCIWKTGWPSSGYSMCGSTAWTKFSTRICKVWWPSSTSTDPLTKVSRRGQPLSSLKMLRSSCPNTWPNDSSTWPRWLSLMNSTRLMSILRWSSWSGLSSSSESVTSTTKSLQTAIFKLFPTIQCFQWPSTRWSRDLPRPLMNCCNLWMLPTSSRLKLK